MLIEILRQEGVSEGDLIKIKQEAEMKDGKDDIRVIEALGGTIEKRPRKKNG